MDNINRKYRKNVKAFWKFVNGSIKSSAKSRIGTLSDGSGSSVTSHTGKVKIVKSHCSRLGSE